MKLRSKGKEKKDKPIVILPSHLFHGLAVYMLTDYRNRTFLAKVKMFFDLVNTDKYMEDGDIEVYYRFIKAFVDTSLDNEIDNTETIYDKIISEHKEAETFEELVQDRLIDEIDTVTPDQARFFENELINRLNIYSLGPHINNMKNTISKYESGDYETYDSILLEINNHSKNIAKNIMAKSVNALDIPDISTGNKEQFLHSLGNVILRMNDEKRVIRSGIRRFNQMISGGFQPGKLYVFCAVSGGLNISDHFKSF